MSSAGGGGGGGVGSAGNGGGGGGGRRREDEERLPLIDGDKPSPSSSPDQMEDDDGTSNRSPLSSSTASVETAAAAQQPELVLSAQAISSSSNHRQHQLPTMGPLTSSAAKQDFLTNHVGQSPSPAAVAASTSSTTTVGGFYNRVFGHQPPPQPPPSFIVPSSKKPISATEHNHIPSTASSPLSALPGFQLPASPTTTTSEVVLNSSPSHQQPLIFTSAATNVNRRQQEQPPPPPPLPPPVFYGVLHQEVADQNSNKSGGVTFTTDEPAPPSPTTAFSANRSGRPPGGLVRQPSKDQDAPPRDESPTASAKAPTATALPRPTRLGGLQRALTLPSSSEIMKSPRRGCRKLPGVPACQEETEEDEDAATAGGGDVVIDIPTISAGQDNRPSSQAPPPPPLLRAESVDNNLMMVIPTFTVTINPMEADEMTFVPDSPSAEDANKGRRSRASRLNKQHSFELSDKEGVVDSNGNVDSSAATNAAVSATPLGVDGEDIRRCSIGSASSLTIDSQNGNANNNNNTSPLMHQLSVPGGGGGAAGGGGCARQLSIRRVSDISHINELRREVSGMEHLGSEYYEISREPNPDNISLDSIHKTVFKRCQNKYIPPQRSTTQNKCFVVVTSGFTILGIIYGFWYKNFGPGSHDHVEAMH